MTWVGVLDACASLARESGIQSSLLDSADRWFSDENTGKVLAGLARDAVDAPEPLHGCLAVFEAVAHDRLDELDGGVAEDGNPKAMAGLRRALRRCGVVCGERTAEDPAVAGAQAQRRGRVLGQVIVLLRSLGAAHDATHIATCALADEGRCGKGRRPTTLDAFAGAVQVPGAGIEATLGCLRCIDDWTQEMSDYAWEPSTLAWLMGGLRLCMDKRTWNHVVESDAWDTGLFRDCVAGMARAAAGWDEDQVRQFRTTARKVNDAVRAFNVEKREQPGQQVTRGWATVTVARAGASEIKRAVEDALRMARAARRLATSGRRKAGKGGAASIRRRRA